MPVFFRMFLVFAVLCVTFVLLGAAFRSASLGHKLAMGAVAFALLSAFSLATFSVLMLFKVLP